MRIFFFFFFCCGLSVLSFSQVAVESTEVIPASQNAGCAPMKVSFDGSLFEGTLHEWDFGNGQSSTLKSPSIVYGSEGDYTVNLTYVSRDGSLNQLRWTNGIRVVKSPTANFTIEDSIICVGDKIQLIDQSEMASSFLWDFGGGHFQSTEDPFYRFESKGTYPVTLIASGEFGCRSSVTKNIVVHGSANNSISVNRTFCCIPSTVFEFGVEEEENTQVRWDFGNGKSSNDHSAHVQYNKYGSFLPSVRLTDEYGCESRIVMSDSIRVFEPISFDIDVIRDIGCSNQEYEFDLDKPGIASVVWDFGDGEGSSALTVSHGYDAPGEYGVLYVSTDTNGCQYHSSPVNFNIQQSPTLILENEASQGCVPMTVEMFPTSKDVSSFRWYLNGEVVSREAKPKLVFNEPGVYDLTVEVEAENGCTVTTDMDEFISVSKPELNYTITDTVGCVPFSPTYSVTPFPNAMFSWIVGGEEFNDVEITPVFDSPGAFDLSLRVEDENGCIDSVSFDSLIAVKDTLIAFSTPEMITVCGQDALVTFDGKSLGKKSWLWDFGDGDSSNLANPMHKFNRPGLFNISLTTINGVGCKSTIPVVNKVNIVRLIPILLQEGVSCEPPVISFKTTELLNASYMWEFGDGHSSTEMSPQHEYAALGDYDLTVIITDSNGCVHNRTVLGGVKIRDCRTVEENDSIVNDNSIITAFDPISVIKKGDSIFGCLPMEISFNVPSGAVDSIYWDFGDGSFSQETSPSHRYEKVGAFKPLLTAYHNGQIYFYDKSPTMIVHAPEDIEITIESHELCESHQVMFTFDTLLAKNWNWVFKGDENYDAVLTEYVPLNSNNIINLNVTDRLGCDQQVFQNFGNNNHQPLLDYRSMLCLSDTLIIEHSITGIDSIKWDFGDGQMSSELRPRHLFSAQGNYNISYTTYSDDNCSKKYQLPSMVWVSSPKANFELLNDSIGCNKLELEIKNTSTFSTNFTWSFGNGDGANLREPEYIYKENGDYDIQLIARSGNCGDTLMVKNAVKVSGLKISPKMTVDSYCFPIKADFHSEYNYQPEQIHWYFGDGSKSKIENPSFEYLEKPSNNPLLLVIDEYGCRTRQELTLDSVLQIGVSETSFEGCVPFEFEIQSITQNAQSIQWISTIGNSQEDSLYLTFNEPTNMALALVGFGLDGCTDTLFLEDSIRVGQLDVDFDGGTVREGCVPIPLLLTNKSTGASNYVWSFGDGDSSYLEQPAHIYNTFGLYDVSLIASNELGCTDTLTRKKYVRADGPGLSFSINDSVFCLGDTLRLIDDSKKSKSTSWYFGDGSSSSDSSTSHVYADGGNYELSVIAEDSLGCKEYLSKEIVIINLPELSFTVDDSASCAPLSTTIHYSGNDSTRLKFLWNIGGEDYPDSNIVDLLIPEPGIYEIKLNVVDEVGCSDSTVKQQFLYVYDTLENFEPIVSQITTHGGSELGIRYNFEDTANFAFHLLYELTDPNTLVLIDTLDHPSGYYNYTASSPIDHAKRFKISTMGQCHAEDLTDRLTTIQSIYNESVAMLTGIKLSWTALKGVDFDHYSVYRGVESGGNFDWIADVSKDSLRYVDRSSLCMHDYMYLVVGRRKGTSDHSESNILSIAPRVNVFKDQWVVISNTTVVDSESILTEWTAPEVAPESVIGYEVQRHVVGISGMEVIAHLPHQAFSYIDNEVNVNEHSYTYRVIPINYCNEQVKKGRSRATIHLKKETSGSENRLFWTPIHLEPDHEDVYYEIQRQDEYGDWETLDEVPAGTVHYHVDLYKED